MIVVDNMAPAHEITSSPLGATVNEMAPEGKLAPLGLSE
jgi:hypothetical protein